MRVTVAAVACLVALVRADSASAAVPADSSRALCSEANVLVEVAHVSAAIGGIDREARQSREVRAPREARDPREVRASREARDSRDATDDTGTLWCVSADDPRCSPLNTSEGGGITLGSAKLAFATGFEPFDPPCAHAAVSGETVYRGSARDGFFTLVERPPNARAA
jgi:hypothetical protein